MLTSCLLNCLPTKPFNPILGETFQAKFNQTQIFCEQISHHPPISSIFLASKRFNVSASLESQYKLVGNYLEGGNEGMYRIDFKGPNKRIETLYMVAPENRFYGVMFGERYLTLEGKFVIVDLCNNLFCECSSDSTKLYQPQKLKSS